MKMYRCKKTPFHVLIHRFCQSLPKLVSDVLLKASRKKNIKYKNNKYRNIHTKHSPPSTLEHP